MPQQEAQARELLAAILRQVDAGVRPAAPALSVETLCDRWLYDREKRGKRSASHERARLTAYVFPKLGSIPAAELRPSHVRELVRDLETLPGRAGGKLAARTVLHVYRTLRQVFSEAIASELLDGRNPVILKKADLPAKVDKDPTWRPERCSARAEVAALLSDDRVPEDRRVLYGLEFLAGMRTGEAAARRWREWTPSLSRSAG
jgi:hypothetical protein